MATTHLKLHPEMMAAIAAHALGDEHHRRLATGYVLCRSSRVSRDRGRGFVGRFVYRHLPDRRSIVETVPGLQLVMATCDLQITGEATAAELRDGRLRLHLVRRLAVLPPVTAISVDDIRPDVLAEIVKAVATALAEHGGRPG